MKLFGTKYETDWQGMKEARESVKKFREKIEDRIKEKSGPLKILLIEMTSAESMENDLKAQGCEVSVAKTTSEALSLDINSFDAVIADSELSVIEALDFVRELNGAHSRVKKIVVANQNVDKSRIQEIEKEGAAFFSKPFGISTILSGLKAAF